MEARKRLHGCFLYAAEKADGREVHQRSVRTYSEGVIPDTARN